MLWKMTNVQLQKGSVLPLYGDSAPFFKLICWKHSKILQVSWVFYANQVNSAHYLLKTIIKFGFKEIFLCLISKNSFQSFIHHQSSATFHWRVPGWRFYPQAEHSAYYGIMALGGFIAAVGDDALQVRTNALLQDMFPSEQRATLISMESFLFSVIMIVLSPLAGFVFTVWWC